MATSTTEIYTLSLHDALPISHPGKRHPQRFLSARAKLSIKSAVSIPTVNLRHNCEVPGRSEEHTSELQSLRHLVCRLLLEKKKSKREILNYSKSPQKNDIDNA